MDSVAAEAARIQRRRIRNELIQEITDFLRQGFYENPRTGGYRAIPGWRNAAEEIERNFKEGND